MVSVLLLAANLVVASNAAVFVPSFSAYPGYGGSLAVKGSMTIHETSGSSSVATQALTWSLTGLDTACISGAADNITNGCGIHVHTGTSCATAGGVGGHYYNSTLASDPWSPVVYTADPDGSSEENSGIEVATGLSNDDITGRVMVIHELVSGARIACGTIGTHTGNGQPMYVHNFDPYPGYSGSLNVAGHMTILGTSGTDTTAIQTLKWRLSGLDTSCSAAAADNITNGCGIHVHTGTSCATAGGVGGHFYSSALAADPWGPVVYVAQLDGSSEETSGIEVITGLSNSDITSRVMVIHELASGRRIACGMITSDQPNQPDIPMTSYSLGGHLAIAKLIAAASVMSYSSLV